MQLTIVPTPLLTTLDGIPVRVWQGVTEDGVPCKVFVHRVRPDATDPVACAAFERYLKEMPPPRAVPLSVIV